MSILLITLLGFYLMLWATLFGWQFFVTRLLKRTHPEEYAALYRNPPEPRIRSDLRFAGWLIFRQYRSLPHSPTIRHLDAFRICLFVFLFVFLLLILVFFMTEKDHAGSMMPPAAHDDGSSVMRAGQK
jgi:hypothetical protein